MRARRVLVRGDQAALHQLADLVPVLGPCELSLELHGCPAASLLLPGLSPEAPQPGTHCIRAPGANDPDRHYDGRRHRGMAQEKGG